MKYHLFLIFCLTSLSLEAQISGQVIDSEGLPISYATVFNLKNKIGCVTDTIGNFKLNASISDSIRIQHISYKSDNFTISKDLDKYQLQRNINDLKEVVVSKNYAAWLYFRGYFNTVSKMQNESRNRMYGSAAKIINTDTLERVSLDLDFESNRSGNNQKSVTHYRFIEIQRYSEQFNNQIDTLLNHPINFQFFPRKGLPGIKEASSREESMNDDYIFQISTDSLFFTVDFIPRKVAPLNSRIFEVTISKKDTCMTSFAAATMSYPFNATKSKDISYKPETMDIAFFYQIEFENGNGYILASHSELNMYYSIGDKASTIRYSVYLKNYAHQPEKAKKRSGIWVIDNNFTFNKKLKSKYSDEFWKNSDFPKKAPYDFEHLRSLKLKKEQL